MKRAPCVATLLLAAACGSADGRNAIAVTDVVVPAPVVVADGGHSPMALYATIRNHGTRDDTLFEIETPVAGSMSVHETVRRGSMATMAPVAHLVIPAGTEVRLEPAGTHAMLESLTRGFAPGDTMPVVFVFANGRRVDVTARVVAYEHLLDALRGGTKP